MNERIKLLAEQAAIMTSAEVTWHKDRISWQKLYDQKFAELIVQECIDIIDPKTGTKWIKDQTQEEFWKNQSVHLIKQHFGVDE